ncbi:hypothetical protein XBFM1_2740018 [Xenorhabdus bovienii str. feltiae Moldova]|uniref:Uncharacterized protein n=1 Tax=Xenorhabdus bovienii str. feltiae Moldova TaxID=1398200 RepID=A0A077NKH7_XENBV|nr:hypothetical protein XBFM1_2740018 [Xenorhabdus bovienii str. feltiae Moldova]
MISVDSINEPSISLGLYLVLTQLCWNQRARYRKWAALS